jgi:hypothetical protein
MTHLLRVMNEADGRLRIGTWNLAGRWSDEHAAFVAQQRCDVWLLTEVRSDVDLDGYHRHFSEGVIVGRRHWVAVFSRNPLRELADRHEASAGPKLSASPTAARFFRGSRVGPDTLGWAPVTRTRPERP